MSCSSVTVVQRAHGHFECGGFPTECWSLLHIRRKCFARKKATRLFLLYLETRNNLSACALKQRRSRKDYYHKRLDTWCRYCGYYPRRAQVVSRPRERQPITCVSLFYRQLAAM